MKRWRKALIAASVGAAASAALVAIPARADTFSLVVDYTCTGGIAGSDEVKLRARVQIPTTVQQGGMLKLGWAIEHVNAPRFKSPDYYAEGAKVSLIGNVKLDGAWNGTLEAHGSKDQGALKPNQPLTSPEGMSSEAHMTETGVIKLRPQAMTVDFVPPAGEVVVNNDDPRVIYRDSWVHDKATRPEYGDWLRDVHTTTTRSDEAIIRFRGTGFEYIGREMPDVGRVRVIIDGVDGHDASAIVDPTKDGNGNPTNATKGNISLWERKDLSYGQHTLRIRSIDDGKPVHLDAFKLHTREMIDPPTEHRSTCVVTNNPGAVEITVGGATSPTPSGTPTGTGDPTDDPTDDPTSTPSGTPTTSGSATPTTSQGQPIGDHVGVVIGGVTTVSPSPKPTTTVTKTVKPQVIKTPKGGVDTGQAPEEPENGSYGLIAGGSLLLMGSATGGLLLRRRRAAHAGGANR
ncbi:hypothetical protein [Nonomuraea cavernae]|uniref:Gram-positive cocci surface proteins LPxTG domain-containing protein n=1 Tax=Nonomuraea cavernae TaxID=2045107 RepID=A0A918DHY6_9ACTN|nr:hypothetical protein [Nonomuraea cavernae]MCA2187249.1 hypothetical protein [Nonomuraea cavernae]GGO68034.1 hypothetical protein GCM10012289_25860 [Nonomuraea cavernae]